MSSTLIGSALALSAAVALNASYLVQHKGSASLAAVDGRRPIATMRTLLRAPVWLLGGILGMVGWGLHIGAMKEAPLSLVQAFVAGGLVLAAPLAAAILRRRLAASEVRAIALMVAALLLLTLGLRSEGAHSHFAAASLGVLVGGLVIAAGLLAGTWSGERRPLALGVAGGLLYGAADLALKGVTGLHGAAAIAASPWLWTALLASVGAFFCFQRGLQSSRPLAVITLMTAATNVSSIAGAFAVYGDPLGRTPLLAAAHIAALVGVVAAAWRLAPAQARLTATA
jgi:hypothetical protein